MGNSKLGTMGQTREARHEYERAIRERINDYDKHIEQACNHGNSYTLYLISQVCLRISSVLQMFLNTYWDVMKLTLSRIKTEV